MATTSASRHLLPHANGRRTAGRLRALDGLRFVAALAVVLFHFTGRNSVAWAEGVRDVFPFLSRFTVYGGFGPYLFFMISGFVVLMSAWRRPVHSFVASRVGRLYPAYWFAVLSSATVLFFNQQVLGTWSSLGLPGVAMNLTMVQPAFGVGHVDGVFWTLWVELKFYVLLALLALIGITRTRVLALCLVWPVLGALAASADNRLLVVLLEPVYAPFFCLGILLYLVYREGWSGSTGLLLALNYCFALWMCASHFIPWTLAVAGSPISFRGVAALLTLSVLAVAAVTLTRPNRLDWRWLTVLGALTYPLYLVHQVPGWVVLHHLAPVLPAYAALGVVVLGCVALAYLVHRFVEQPCGARLRRAVERDLAGRTRRIDDGSGDGRAARSTPAVDARVPQPRVEEPAGDQAPPDGGSSWMRSIVAVVEIDGVRGR